MPIFYTGKGGAGFLETAVCGLPTVNKIFPQLMGSEAELGAGRDNLELPAVVSEILMELPTII